jgi:hypothetical protein
MANALVRPLGAFLPSPSNWHSRKESMTKGRPLFPTQQGSPWPRRPRSETGHVTPLSGGHATPVPIETLFVRLAFRHLGLRHRRRDLVRSALNSGPCHQSSGAPFLTGPSAYQLRASPAFAERQMGHGWKLSGSQRVVPLDRAAAIPHSEVHAVRSAPSHRPSLWRPRPSAVAHYRL